MSDSEDTHWWICDRGGLIEAMPDHAGWLRQRYGTTGGLLTSRNWIHVHGWIRLTRDAAGWLRVEWDATKTSTDGFLRLERLIITRRPRGIHLLTRQDNWRPASFETPLEAVTHLNTLRRAAISVLELPAVRADRQEFDCLTDEQTGALKVWRRNEGRHSRECQRAIIEICESGRVLVAEADQEGDFMFTYVGREVLSELDSPLGFHMAGKSLMSFPDQMYSHLLYTHYAEALTQMQPTMHLLEGRVNGNSIQPYTRLTLPFGKENGFLVIAVGGPAS